MKSAYFRNFLATACMMLFCSSFMGVIFIMLGRNYLIVEKRDSLSKTADATIRSAVSSYRASGSLDYLNNPSLRINITNMASTTGNHIFICDAGGRVVSCSDLVFECPHFGMRLSNQTLHSLSAGNTLNSLSDLDGFYDRVHYVQAAPIVVDGSVIGFVFAASDSTQIIVAWQAFGFAFSSASGIILIAAVIMAYITARQQAKPINEIAHAARRFAHGEFSVRVPEYGAGDEISELVIAFNAMAESLENSEERRRDFIANVSHELKTPMTTISGFADGLLDGTIPKENQDRYLRTISDETKRLSRLVLHMLDLSRIESETPEALLGRSFDISETLRQTLLYFESRILGKGLDVETQLPENNIDVLGDEDSIKQVVYNLLENAIKFSDPGSTLGLSLWKQGAKAYVSVKNHGESIPEEELQLIFERFHKTDRSRSRDREGVGLGLNIVKSILNNHGEDISVSSRDGETEFLFTLALAPEKKSRREA